MAFKSQKLISYQNGILRSISRACRMNEDPLCNSFGIVPCDTTILGGANYRNINKDIEYSPIYLVRFFRNLLLGESWVLKNRYLHIDPTDEWKVQPRLATPQAPHTPHQKVDRKGGQKTEKVGRKGGQKTKESILSLIATDPFVTTNEMSKRLEINRSAISKHIKKLKEDHIIERIGPDKGGKWLIKK